MQKKKKNTGKPNDLQTNPVNGSPFSPMDLSSGQTSQPGQSSGTYHQSCQTLLYDTFLNIIVSGDVNLLLISGRADAAQLRAAWENILQEYSETVQTEKTRSIASLWRKIVYTRWKINFLEQALDYLKHEYDHEIAEQITLIGYDFIEDREDREAYLKQIYMVERESKTLVIVLNQYNNEYKLINPDGAHHAERTMKDYDKELAIIGMFVGFRIDKKIITVAEFASYVNLYLEDVEAKKRSK